MNRLVLVLVVLLLLENTQTGWDVEDDNEKDERIGSWVVKTEFHRAVCS